MHHAAALGARRCQHAEIAGDGVLVVELRLADDLLGEVPDLAHELLTRQLPSLHLLQLIFPVARHLRLRQLLHTEAIEQLHQRKCFRRRDKLASIAMDIRLVDQTFDGRRARGRRAETAITHRLAQFIVFDCLARALHRAEQRRFRVARRRLRHVALHLDVARDDVFILINRCKRRRVVIGLRLLAIHFQPAGFHQNLARALERLGLNARDADGFQKFSRRIEHGEKPLRHHFKQPLLRLAQALRQHAGRNDRKVIADFCVVEDAFVRAHPVVGQNFFCKPAEAREVAQRIHRLLHRGDVILRQMARIRSRIRQHLVPLVKRLGDGQRILRAETEARVGVALQRGEIVKPRRHLRGRLGFLGDDAGFAEALGADGVRLRLVPDALRLEINITILAIRPLELLVKPAPFVVAHLRTERAEDFPVIARLERAHLRLALDNNCQRRRLHAAHGGFEKSPGLAVERSHRPRAIDAHEPVGFAAADGGVRQRLHGDIGAQLLKAVTDRGGRHGLEPEALDRLLGIRVIHDAAEDEFALAPGVAGIDECIHIFAFDELHQNFQAVGGTFDGLETKLRRDVGQGGEGPFATLDVVLLGDNQLEQMADGGRDDVFLALVEVARLVFGHAAERLGEVACDGRFFRNDENFTHAMGLPLPRCAVIWQRLVFRRRNKTAG